MNSLKNFDLYEIYLNWRNNTNAFECFLKSTPFVSLKNYPDFTLDDFNISFKDKLLYNKIKTIIEKHNLLSTIFILDMPGHIGVKMSYLLQNNDNIKPILTFNALLHPYGLVGNKTYISNLLQCGSGLKDISPEGYIFILDNGRYLADYDGKSEESFNNQYETTEEDMPSIELLNELSYLNTVYIYIDKIKEDIDCYLNYLEHYNITINKYKIGDY